VFSSRPLKKKGAASSLRPRDFSNGHGLSAAQRCSERARVVKANSVIKLLGATQQYPPGDVATLEAQVADLKQVAALLRAQLSEVREQRDMWQTRAERISLATKLAVASRARPWWRP
jgi:hypothetical protein